jgi:hypothetical protein
LTIEGNYTYISTSGGDGSGRVEVEVSSELSTEDFEITNIVIEDNLIKLTVEAIFSNDRFCSIELNASLIVEYLKSIWPFRVLEDGSLYAENADISGTVKSESGTIGGWYISSDGINNGDLFLSGNSVLPSKSFANPGEFSRVSMYSGKSGTKDISFS